MCELGKDRTALLVPLVLGCCQVSTELILDDDELSDGVMFAEAPRVAMLAAFTDLDENYGGCQAYLAEIGLDWQRQSEMRRRICSNDRDVIWHGRSVDADQ